MTKATIDPEAIVKKVLKVASLPEVFIKVEEVLNNPHSSSDHLKRIIDEDPALTARLLRLANSAYYGFHAKVESVSQAITILGTQQLRELVLACSVLKVFSNISDEQISMESYWRHSIACGLVARSLASLRYENNVEHYFVAGLLHDIGRLVLLMERPHLVSEIFEQANEEKEMLFVVERQHLGFNHAQLGGLLLKNWKLSSRLVEAVSFHHRPKGAKNFPIDAAIVHIADHIANALEMGSSGEQFVPKLNPDAWDLLELDVDCLDQVIETLDQQYNDAISFILAD